jgi:carbamoyltransferase
LSVIVGLNCYHADSAACLVVDGTVVGAVEEERLVRKKHWAGFPKKSILQLLGDSSMSATEVDFIAINRNPLSNIFPKVLYGLLRDSSTSMRKFLNRSRIGHETMNEIRDIFPNIATKKIHYVDHHLAHLASGFFPSTFDRAALVSVDGFGDFCSTMVAEGANRDIKVHSKELFPHSLGILYQAVTQWLGFKNYGDEYKVMGMSSYGSDTLSSELSRLVELRAKGRFHLNLDFFQHHNYTSTFTGGDGTPRVEQLYSDRLNCLLGPSRKPHEDIKQIHLDVACSLQRLYERILFHILNEAYARCQTDQLVLTGGCAMNSLANGKIYQNTDFKQVYIPSSPGDSGGAVGAALYVANKFSEVQPQPMRSAYLGPAAKETDVEHAVETLDDLVRRGDVEVTKFEAMSEVNVQTVNEICNGAVVGWYQGRMEWGPRALGNRSILADPRRSDMKDIINTKIKLREAFRPFAPSVLSETTSEWFEMSHEVPYMSSVFMVKEDKRAIIPAVVHVDGSGRLQTVKQQDNLAYYDLINEFYQRTGVPMLLNTSFNENEPIVSSPTQAANCFRRTSMDVLVLGKYFIKRTQ